MAGVIVRTKRKKQEVKIKSPDAFSQNELAEIMYEKQITFADEIEVIDVVYSIDKLKRFITIKNHKDLYSYCYETVELLDEEEYDYMIMCGLKDVLPANWITPKEFDNVSFYDSIDAVMKEITIHPEYIEYFTR